MKLFDSHCHYMDEKFKEDRKEVIESALGIGIIGCVCAGYNMESSEQALEIAKEYKQIYMTCGVSPNDVEETIEETEKIIEKIEKLIQREKQNGKLVAVGEIGLDYYWNTENKEIQKEAFIKQIKLANQYHMPIVIHTREAVQDTLDILKNVQKPEMKGVFHCCPFNRELVKEALKLDFYISFAGPVTFKNSKNAKEIVEMVPLDHILIETDSPYLSPEPKRGTRNDSTNLIFIAQKIADFKNVSIEEIAEISYENAKRIYSI